VSRSGYYRSLVAEEPDREEMETRAAVQEVALAHKRRYGYRRVAFELRRRGMAVNHKRVARLMREDNLLAIGRRHYILTTDSRHSEKISLNLAGRLEVTGVDQLWVADITYIRLHREFVFLAVVLDRYSRRVVGWALDRTLATRLTVAALEKALAHRKPAPGLVHHSDRGVQYAAREYRELLRSHAITPSMSRRGNPYDNAHCETFMKTLKQEEILCSRYRDLEDLAANLTDFIENYYNHERLHSALGYRPPAEFEAAVGSAGIAALTAVSFSRHGEIYRSDGGIEYGDPGTGPPSHRLDEFPTGYSSTGCSPAEPASASPVNLILPEKG
jgi:transposase InsO family protein